MYQDKYDYIRKLFGKETPELRAIREGAAGENDKISIYPEEARLLQFLIHACKVKTIVEIGTLHGYSALSMAEALPNGGHLYTIEKDDARAAKAERHFQPSANNYKITLLRGDALRVLNQLSPQGPFDMVFIDADKLNYPHYLDWAEDNIRSGGLIVGDNTLLFDAVWKEELPERVRKTAQDAMRSFNERLADPKKYTGIMLPTTEGMTIALKK